MSKLKITKQVKEVRMRVNRYVLNTRTLEVHDREHTTGSCMLLEIPERRRVYLSEREYIELRKRNPKVNGCHWCNKNK